LWRAYVRVLGVDDPPDGPVVVHIELIDRPLCVGCGARAAVKDRNAVVLVDLPVFGRRSLLGWRKHRWSCPNRSCEVLSWTGEDSRARVRHDAARRCPGRRPFHVVGLANSALDECRRLVLNETPGHRGRKDDPLCLYAGRPNWHLLAAIHPAETRSDGIFPNIC
jgi:hypothetical protein